jgi:steroid delta-isomerase-like uncharacterized protein
VNAVVTETGTVVRAFVRDVWNGADLDAIDDLTTEDFALHQLVAEEDHDRESFRNFQTQLLDAMPDFSLVLEDLVVEGDRAIAHATMGGTPEEPMQALQPTGESFSVNAFHKYRLDAGRIDEVWVMADALSTLNQLGLFPPPPGMILKMVATKVKGRLFGS